MAITRTIGPLHFEDLEPNRFEDLVRQLAYEFKLWRRLEATGRSGSDNGFDVRGYEITAREPQSSALANEGGQPDEQLPVDEFVNDRLWLIQCKRERAIGPKALLRYLDDTVLDGNEVLHGLVFTAACDFSKKARDDFAEKCRSMGVEEWYLWGKAELEDRLFRPENDHLLFAYFGVSLTVRRRSQSADLRARLAIKRKANRILNERAHAWVLLRSTDTAGYPHLDDLPAFNRNPPCMVLPYRGMGHDGLLFCVKRYFAYISDDGKSWDAAMAVNEARGTPHQDPWLGRERQDQKRQRIHDFWNSIPELNRAWFEVVAQVPFDSILDIDELGDEFVESPHVYAAFPPGNRGPFTGFRAEVESIDRWVQRALNPRSSVDRRVEYFPAEFRDADDRET